MFTHKKLSLISLLLVLSLILAACTSSSPKPDTGETGEQPQATQVMEEAQPTSAEPAEKKVATFIFTQEFDTLNPLYTGMWFSAITQEIWNTSAWNFDETNTPQPVLVTEIPSVANGGVSADGRVITLKLRDDLQWSDGTPITSADFLFTYQMTIDPKNIVASTYPYDLIETVKTPDPQTVITTFTEPFVPWTATLWTYLLPAHILQPVFEADGSLDAAEWNNAPTVGAGPYLFAEWESGSYTRFVRNENYFGTQPKIDEIFIRFVPDDASQTAALQTGDGDLGAFIPYSDVPTLQEAGVEILSVPSGYNEGWFFNMRDTAHPALSDARVRQAIALGFDRAKLSQDLLLGLTQPAATFWDNTPYTPADIQPWSYDVEQANALLDEAGWVDSNGDGTRDKDGVELVLIHGTTTREIRKDVQAVAQQQLAAIGIGLELRNYESDIFFASYGDNGPCATGELDICESSNAPAFPDPDVARFLCSEVPTDEYPDGSNEQGLCDEALDALFQSQAAQADPAARIATFHEIARMMYEQVYWLGIWQDPDIWAVSGRLTNTTLSGADPFFDIVNWDIEN